MKIEKIKLEPTINEEMYTDTNGKLTIIINTKNETVQLFFDDCNFYYDILRKGRKGNVNICKTVVFIGKIMLPLSSFSNEQIQYLKEFI